MTILDTHIVPENVSGVRLSDYAVGIFPAISSRKGIKKMIKKGGVCINGVVAETGRWVETGQKIQLIELMQVPEKVYRLSFPVIYEDAYLAIISKPAGIVVSGNQFRTIQNALLYNIALSELVDALPNPLPVHRLDYSTSGLLIIAKTRGARQSLGKLFEERQISKTYQAVVIGHAPINSIIQQPIEGKFSETSLQRLRVVQSLKNNYLSLVNLMPLTGRTHQLRIHLSSVGFPILGDKIYGKEGMILKGKGLFLSAIGLQFIHPITSELMKFSSPAPLKFQSFMEREQRRWDRWQSAK